MNLIRETFQAAIDKLATRKVVASNRNSAEWQDMPIAIRERAFWSATIEDVKFLQRMQDEISDYLQQETEDIPKSDEADGGTALRTGGRAVFIERMRELAIAEGMGPLDPADEGTIKDIRSEARLGLIFDTQVRMAQDYASYREGLQPDVLDAFPAQRFIREADREKPRDRSARYEGAVALKTNHKFWADTVNASKSGGFGTPYGPWGFGSGMDVEDVAREEVEAPEGESADPADVRMPGVDAVWLLKPGEAIPPAAVEGFNDAVQASARGLSPASVQNLKDAFGSQIEITGDTMRWTPAPGTRPAKGGLIAEKAKSLDDALAQAGWHKGEPVTPRHLVLVRDIFSRNITEPERRKYLGNVVDARPPGSQTPEFPRRVLSALADTMGRFSTRALARNQPFVVHLYQDFPEKWQRPRQEAALYVRRGKVLHGIKGPALLLRESLPTAELPRHVAHEVAHWVADHQPDYMKSVKKWFGKRVSGLLPQELFTRPFDWGYVPSPPFIDKYAGLAEIRDPLDKNKKVAASEFPSVYLEYLVAEDVNLFADKMNTPEQMGDWSAALAFLF